MAAPLWCILVPNMEVRTQNNLHAAQESFLQRHFPRWCPSTHAFFRRQSLRVRKRNLASALEDTGSFPPAYGYYAPKVVEAQTAMPTEFQQILAGYYTPDPEIVNLPGVQAQENNQPDEVHNCQKYPIALSADVCENEVPTLDQTVTVDPSLLAKLQMHAMFRPRDTDLLLSLKAKGLQELRTYRNSSSWKSHQLAMATALAFVPSEQEKLALSHLRSPIPSANWLWVNDVLNGGNSSLLDHRAKAPALVTRIIDWLGPKPDKLRKLQVN